MAYRLPFSRYPKAFPDEDMRLRLPQFFYETGRLPTGAEEFVRYERWGFSYASYPLMLTTLLAGMLMKGMALITTDPDWLVFAARLVSIMSATAFAYFAARIGRTLFSGPAGYLFAAIPLLLPQFIFCGLYFNNDMPAMCGGAIILYSWLLGLRDGWRLPNLVLMGVGVGVVALTYYNAYSWILLSAVVYFAVWRIHSGSWSVLKTGMPWMQALPAVGMACAIAGPFFIRAGIINHGDILGFRTIREYGMRYAVPELRPDSRPTPQHLGMSLWDMLTTTHYMGEGNNWPKITFKSFVGVFGYMTVYLPRWFYLLYGLFFVLGAILFFITVTRRWRGGDRTFGHAGLLDAVLLANAAIVFALALYYSYATDYQAQGRYLFPLMLSLAYVVASGWDEGLRIVKANPLVQRVFVAIVIIVMLGGDYVAVSQYLLA